LRLAGVFFAAGLFAAGFAAFFFAAFFTGFFAGFFFAAMTLSPFRFAPRMMRR
jgi:hypothetical protein